MTDLEWQKSSERYGNRMFATELMYPEFEVVLLKDNGLDPYPYIIDQEAKRDGEHGTTARLVGACWMTLKRPDGEEVTVYAKPCPAYENDLHAALQLLEKAPRWDIGIDHGKLTISIGEEPWVLRSYPLDGPYDLARRITETWINWKGKDIGYASET
jgi:hypothetical protein